MLDGNGEIKKQENPIIEMEVAETSENNEIRKAAEIDISEMSMEELILEMSHFSENSNVLAVSKKAEEVRSVFYQQLKQINKEDLVAETEESDKKEKKATLHPLEIKFRKEYNKFKREKTKSRKNKELEERKNLLYSFLNLISKGC